MSISRRRFLSTGLGSAGLLLAPTWPLRAQSVRYSSDPFSLGVASGYPEPDAVTLWTRLAPVPMEPGGGMLPAAVLVDWEVAEDERFRRVVRSGSTWATPDWAHAVHVDVTGLRPGRAYWYRFTAGDARSPVGRTATAPATGADVHRLVIGVASCQYYERFNWAAYNDMADGGLDLIVHVGDYIYEQRGRLADAMNGLVRSHDLPEAHTLDDYRQRHALYKLDPLLQAAHAACPWLVTWDDHDVDDNYAGARSENNDDPAWFLARRANAYRAFYEHMPMPRQHVPFGPYQRMHTSRSFGSLVDLFMLDGRQYRSERACGGGRVSNCDAVFDTNRTMLGAAQELWLDQSLASASGRWTLMAQGVVFAHQDTARGEGVSYWAEDWNAYAAPRQRLMDGLAVHGTRNPVVLSGDIHAFQVNDVHAKPGDFDSPVAATEFVTTSISSGGPEQSLVDTWLAENPNLRYARGDLRGYLRLTLTPESLRADLVAVDDPRRADSATHTAASFEVEDGRAGVAG